jgi:hypothetical protein
VSARVTDPGDEYVLNHCTKQFNRSGLDEKSSATISEAWRFPIVGPLREDNPAPFDGNLVTFVYRVTPGDARPVQILGTFATLYQPIPLKRVLFQSEDTGYRAVSFEIPQSQVHTYKFYVEGGSCFSRQQRNIWVDNAEAILNDYRNIGDAIWDRFTGRREGTIWYYRELSAFFDEVLPGPLSRELSRTVSYFSSL